MPSAAKDGAFMSKGVPMPGARSLSSGPGDRHVSAIAGWLRGIGLGSYARVFEDNDIDLDGLHMLTEGMLMELGLPVGARLKLLTAIAQMGASAASQVVAGPPQDDLTPAGGGPGAARPWGHSPLVAGPPQDAMTRTGGGPGAARRWGRSEVTASLGPTGRSGPGERRQLTVMFCDLVDSTELATQLDPEDYNELIHAYRGACQAVIDRHGGHVAQYLGDGVMAYFGWPTAHEDGVERAVRTGLEIIPAVHTLPGPRTLGVRVGIHTGIVVIDDPEGLAVGDTPHIASRLQSLAAPDTLLITEATSRLISGRFERQDLGMQSIKGRAEPIRVLRVTGVREDMTRFPDVRSAALSPLVGREAELALLKQRWRDAAEGEGQVVFVSGVPGIGKSRLVYELERALESTRHASLSFQCLPQYAQSALFPVIQQIERLCQFAPQDADELKLTKIERLLAGFAETNDQSVPLLAALLSIPTDGRYPRLVMTAQQMKASILQLLSALIVRLAEHEPVLCLLEDAQWIDASTQELLELLIPRIAAERILLVVTHRPEYHVPEGNDGTVSAIAMPRLSRRDAARLAQAVLRGVAVPEEVIRRIVDRSDAVPLFVEELALGVSAPDSRAAWDQEKPEVPATLRDSLRARLDRAPEAREVAQIAAVVGREFSYDTLRDLVSLPKDELDATLEHLERVDIIQQSDRPGAGLYEFKHALLRDAAYESLLKSGRREMHERVARLLERRFPDTVAAQPELLAFHFSHAENAEKAAHYWLAGGRRAQARSANVEAIAQFQKALKAMQSLPETRARDETELDLQLSLGLCFVAVRGYSSDDTRIAFERARELSERLDAPKEEARAVFGLWGHYWMTAHHDRAIGLAENLLKKAERLHDPVALAVAHRALGSTLFTLGELDRARQQLELAIRLSGERGGAQGAFVVDPRIAAHLMLGWDLWILGRPDAGLENVREALRLADASADPYSIAFTHYVASAIHLLRGEAQASLEHADTSLALSTEQRINLYALYSRFGRGCALCLLGRHDDAVAEIRAGIEEARRSRLGYMHAFMLGWLATAKLRRGDPETALSTLDEAFRHVSDVAGRVWEAELLRLRGDCLLAARSDAAADAERDYRHAIAVAQHQGARALELRASASLARLLRDQGKSLEARALLSEVVDRFTEGLETADVRDARALLDELPALDAKP
jgi:class 3 adenylate cyclase/tetratricopeptide (TPR) repeat protein